MKEVDERTMMRKRCAIHDAATPTMDNAVRQPAWMLT